VSYDAAEIAALCAAHNLPTAKVADFLARKLTVDQTAKEILNMQTNHASAAAAVEKQDINFGIGNEIKNYSLFKAAIAQSTHNWANAGFEREVSNHIAKHLGMEPKGFMLPYSIFNTMTSGGAGTGAELVGTDHLADQFIDALRAKTRLGQMGATIIEGLKGDVDIPKLLTGGTFYMVAEDGAPSVSTPTTGTLPLSPKSGSAAVHLSRKLLKQSSPSVEAMIRSDLLKGVALLIDNEGINGTGADNRPLGILLTPSVNTSVVTSAGNPDWDEIVAFETAVEADNAEAETMYFLTTPAVKGAMNVKPRFASPGLPIWADNNTVNGYNALTSTQVPSNGIIFGDFSSLVIGMWGAIDLVVDTATDISKGGIVLRPWVEFDLGLRHIESFCINA
jgi:HK97 family phage major capsid protein